MADKEYKSAEELKIWIDEYFRKMERAQEFPDYAGMKLFIGVKKDETIQKLCEDPDYADVFEEAKLRRESFLVRTMARDNKRAQGCLNALKQPINGGYNEKPVDSGERKLKIIIDGVGENATK